MFLISKLFVMHRKLMKFVKSLDAVSSPKKINFLEFSLKDKLSKCGEKKLSNQNRGFSHLRNQMPVFKHGMRKNQPAQRFFMTKKRATLFTQERIFNIILRYLNLLASDFNRRNFWKSHLSEIFNNKRVKNVWTANKYDNAPCSLRRFTSGRDDIYEESKSSKSLGSGKARKQYENTKQREEFDTVFKRIAEQYNGTAEQNFYTQSSFVAEGKYLKGINLNQFSKSGGQKRDCEEAELPPPQRCRLSCPLPPPEYDPPKCTEFLPNNQSPAVKFSSQPAEFLPSKTVKNDNQYYILKTNNRIFSGNPKPPKKTQSLVPKEKQPNKIYPSAFNQFKPTIYESNATPKMKALLFEPHSLELNYFAVDAPTHIYKDEVLVQVIYSGVCGTDLFITEGKMFCRDDPVILGHEISGKVYAVGSDVHHVKSGDNVAINPYTACCICRYCNRGLFSSCLNEGLNNSIGISKDGGWAEYVVVKKSQIHKVPPKLGLDQAALIQPLSCVLSAMSKLNLSNDLDIMIQGLGLTGCLWASVLHSKGYKNVFVSDKNEKKKEQFQSLNLDYTFVPPEEIGQYSADVIVECTGSPQCIEKSLKILNPNGQICFFGKPNPVAEIRCIPYEIVKKEITIVGNTGNAFCFSKAVDLATMMGYRYLDFEKLGVRVFDLQDFREAFQLKKSGEVGKIMFKFES